MKILVTGATGFIGKNFTKRLLDKGHDVVALGRSLDKLGALREKVRAYAADINDTYSLRDIIKREKPDIAAHCAAVIHTPDRKLLHRVNVEGTKSVLDACFTEGVKKVIYLSTIATISANPDIPLTEDAPYKASQPYGESKIEAEKVAREYRKKGLKIAILRPGLVYGEYEPHALERLIRMIRLRVFPVLASEKKMHMTCVHTVVDVMMIALANEAAYDGVFNIADKEVLTIKELGDYIAKIIGARPPWVVPVWITAFLSKIPYVRRLVFFFSKDRIYSIERLRAKLGYAPRVSVYDGLKRAVESYVK